VVCTCHISKEGGEGKGKGAGGKGEQDSSLGRVRALLEEKSPLLLEPLSCAKCSATLTPCWWDPPSEEGFQVGAKLCHRCYWALKNP